MTWPHSLQFTYQMHWQVCDISPRELDLGPRYKSAVIISKMEVRGPQKLVLVHEPEVRVN